MFLRLLYDLTSKVGQGAKGVLHAAGASSNNTLPTISTLYRSVRNYSIPAKPIYSQVLWVSNSAPTFSRFFRGGFITAEKRLRDKLSKFYISKVVWSPKQGGCYLHFVNNKEAQMAAREINRQATKMKAFFVEGDPFVEDLVDRKPSLALMIKMKGPILNNEDIFVNFRKYGRLRELQLDEKTSTAKVIFQSLDSANAARNCAHMKKLGETVLDVEYTPYTRWKIPVDLFTSPRAIVPIAGLLVTSITLLLNPIRLYFVTQRLTVEQGIGLTSAYEELATFGHGMHSYAFHKLTKLESDLKRVLDNKPNNVLLMVGPKGTTKSSLLRKILQKRMFSVRIDCSKADSVQEFVELFVREVGFRPSFTALNTIFSWFSSIVPAAVAPSLESQLLTLLTTIDKVLFVARTTDSKPIFAFDEFDHFLRFLNSENKDEVKKANAVLKLLASWSLQTAKRGDAHIIFVANNVYAEDVLRKAEGLKSLPVFYVHDISNEEAITYLTSQLAKIEGGNKIDKTQLNMAVNVLGGRQADLDHFLFLLSHRYTVDEAMTQMLEEAKKVIRRRGFGSELFAKTVKTTWTQVHLWKAMRQLHTNNHVKYDQLLVTVFEGNESALQGLVEANILSVSVVDGQKIVTAFSPLYLAAFRDIINNDLEFVHGMDKFTKETEIAKDLAKVDLVENELVKLGRVLYHENALQYDFTGVKKRIEQLDSDLQVLVSSVGKKKTELAEILARQTAMTAQKR